MQYQVSDFRKSSNSYPASWEGTLQGGRRFYIKYNYGSFSVQVSDHPTKDPMDAVKGSLIVDGITFPSPRRNPFDGEMSTEEMVERTSEAFDWSEVEELVERIKRIELIKGKQNESDSA